MLKVEQDCAIFKSCVMTHIMSCEYSMEKKTMKNTDAGVTAFI